MRKIHILKITVVFVSVFIIVFLSVFAGCKIKETDDGGDEEEPTEFYVSVNGNDSNEGSQSSPWRTIQHALDLLEPGHTLTILPGTYKETLHLTRSGSATKRIYIKGQSYSTTLIDGTDVEEDLFFIEDAKYIEISELTFSDAPRAAIRLSNSDYVAIRNCLIADNGKWGIFTDFSNNTTIDTCDIYGSLEEHGIYISNSSDDAVIRSCLVHHNAGSGIQINADPSMGGDGISYDCLIDSNLVYENGTSGGAAINLASVRESTIQNNVVVYNYAGGIAAWDDEQGWQWGCKDLVIIHNTVYFRPTEGRWALSMKNGSTGAIVYNNILAGGRRGGFEFNADVLRDIQIDYNIYYRYNSTRVVTIEDSNEYTLNQWRSSGYDLHSISDTPSSLFQDTGSGNFRLRNNSSAIDFGYDLGLDHDFEGDTRPQGDGPDNGADEVE